MRHKTITLCPTTYEIARKMPNFSKWIRQELMKKHALIAEAKPNLQEKIHGAWCKTCDVTFKMPAKHAFMLQKWHYCEKCGTETEYLGELA